MQQAGDIVTAAVAAAGGAGHAPGSPEIDECIVWGAYERMAERLRRAAFRVCHDGHDAEDAVHDAILAAHRSVRQLRDPARLDPWLVRIAKNQAATQARRRRRFRPDGRYLEEEPEHPEERPRVAVRFGSHEPPADAVLAVRTAFDESPLEWRETFRARFQRGLTFAQIAAEQGISVACVKTRLSRVRARLREAFPDR